MKIAIQGELGSFSHQAALEFEPEAEIAPCMRASEAFTQLAQESCDAIALPLENTLAGSVVEHYDLLLSTPVHIEREAIIRIEHMLIGLPSSTENTIRRVYSHPVALAQCRRFFLEHPSMEAIPFYDTAGAVKQIVELRERHAGAVAGALAARIYGGSILLAGIEDNPANFTRFLLLRRGAPRQDRTAQENVAGGNTDSNTKLSFAFELEDQAGALSGVLQRIAKVGASITKLQTRPIPGRPWQYTFYLDCLVSSPPQSLLALLRPECASLHDFGSYAAAVFSLPETPQ